MIIYLDSWSTNTKQLIKPIINYENYQLQCLLPNQSVIYDSSFADDDSTKSYLSVVSVGSDASTYSITINIFVSAVSCTIATYNRVLINVTLFIIHHRITTNSPSCSPSLSRKLHPPHCPSAQSLKKGRYKFSPQADWLIRPFHIQRQDTIRWMNSLVWKATLFIWGQGMCRLMLMC